MWFNNIMCVSIFSATLKAENYYESESTTWENITCKLGEPQLKYHNGYFEVNETLTISDDVWIGYLYTKVPFLLLGCASLQSEKGVDVNEIGECFSICGGGQFGIKRTRQESGLLCSCVMASLDTNEPRCKDDGQSSICNNCYEIYKQINVNASNVSGSGNTPEGDCLTYFHPQFNLQPCSRTDAIRSMCSNATYTDLTATATIDGWSVEWSAGNKICLTNGQHPSFERSIQNSGFNIVQSQYHWTGIFRENVLIQLSLKDFFSRFSTDSHVFANRSSKILWVANNGDMNRAALCVTRSESTSSQPESSKYTTEVSPSITQSTYSETSVFITTVTTSDVAPTDWSISSTPTTHMYTTLATHYSFPTSNDGIIEGTEHTNSEKSNTLEVGIGVSVGILLLVGGAVVFVVLKRRRVLSCWKITTTECQPRRIFEERNDTNYEGMIYRNENNDNYCVLGRHVDSDVGAVSNINQQSNLNITQDKSSSEYYNMGSCGNVQKAHNNTDFENK